MYGVVTLCDAAFQTASTNNRLDDSLEGLPSLLMAPTTPSQHRRQAVPLRRFRLVPFRSPLLRESRLLSFPRGTEMFQFPRFPLLTLCVQVRVTGHDPSRVSPFGHPWIKAWSTAPHGFSQPPTSFIGIWRQGIHRWLFVAWDIRCVSTYKNTTDISLMLVLAMQFSRDECGGRIRCAAITLEGERAGRRAESARRPMALRLPQNGTVNHHIPWRPVVPPARSRESHRRGRIVTAGCEYSVIDVGVPRRTPSTFGSAPGS